MDIAVALILLGIVAAVVLGVSAPVRAARRGQAPAMPATHEREELEAERDAKYREIRDAEMDLRTGKLSEDDHREVDGTLRAEALEILERLEALERADG